MGILIPLFALAIPLLVIGFNGMQKVQRLCIEELKLRAGDGGDGAAIDELRGEVDALRQELAEVHERLDFTERLLARHADGGRLPGAPTA